MENTIPPKPKKPLNSFNLFKKDIFLIMKKKYKNQSKMFINIKISEHFSLLDEKKKKNYENIYLKNLQNFKLELKNYHNKYKKELEEIKKNKKEKNFKIKKRSQRIESKDVVKIVKKKKIFKTEKIMNKKINIKKENFDKENILKNISEIENGSLKKKKALKK